MNQTITMGQAPSVRASRALRSIDVRKMCVRALALARRKSVTLTVISTIAVYGGLILGSDPLTYTSAAAALGFVYLADSTQKGGER